MYESEAWVRAKGINLEVNIYMVLKATRLGEITWGGSLGQSCAIEHSSMMERFHVHVCYYLRVPIAHLKSG